MRRHIGDDDEEVPGSSIYEADEAPKRESAGRVRIRGTYVTFTEYWHGKGAVGVMSIADNRKAPGLTLIDGFDCELAAHNVVSERHGIPT